MSIPVAFFALLLHHTITTIQYGYTKFTRSTPKYVSWHIPIDGAQSRQAKYTRRERLYMYSPQQTQIPSCIVQHLVKIT